MTLSNDKQVRKDQPMARGLLDYFPDALAEVAHVSQVANEQHNPGQEMHWAKEKSTDHADCIVRHLVDRGTVDDDGLRHSAKVAWRALALLQVELDRGDACSHGEYANDCVKSHGPISDHAAALRNLEAEADQLGADYFELLPGEPLHRAQQRLERELQARASAPAIVDGDVITEPSRYYDPEVH